jgi:hypothetical protein
MTNYRDLGSFVANGPSDPVAIAAADDDEVGQIVYVRRPPHE